MSTPELIHELRHPHNDFPSYFTDLCARAADALEQQQAEGEQNNQGQTTPASVTKHADKTDKAQFRAGQRDGFSIALRAIHVDQQQAGHSA
jgi:hypothetical protein